MPTVKIQKISDSDYRCNEAYKTLRTNIQLCGSDMKVIMFTSTAPNEGKSSVSFNLAVSLAESGKKVIFIDADLRKSVLVNRYKITSSTKLTQLLVLVNWKHSVMALTLLIRNKKHQSKMYMQLVTVLPFMIMPSMM